MSSSKQIPEALRKALAKGSLERAFTVQRETIDEATRTASLAFASELPYERWWGIEVLECTPTAVRTGRLRSGANLLCDHNATDVVGVVESVEIGADRVGRAVVRFGKSARAEEVWQDVRDGIRQNVSVGYIINKAVLVETNDGRETYRVTDWEPFEVSLVSVPADPSVGIGRSHVSVSVTVETDDAEDAEEDAAEAPGAEAATAPGAEPIPMISTTSSQEKTMTDVTVVETRNHSAEISKLAPTIAGEWVPALALKSIQAGHTVEQFQAEVLRSMSSNPLPTPSIGMSPTETKRYSVLRAIRAMVDKDWSNAGLEREAHKAILKRAGLDESPNNGFFLPYEVQKRDLSSTGGGSSGGYLVATNNLAGSFIDLLRNRALIGQLGATMLSGLVGNITIPKQSGANTAYWLANETTQATEGNLTLGQLALAPKNVAAYQEISRQLMLQSDPSVDALVMNDLAKVLGLAIDLAAFEGSSSGGQPTGISQTAGIGSVTGTSIDYAKVLEFQTDVASANALAENCAYVTTPAVAALLAQRQRFTSTDSPLWTGNILNGQVTGFRAMSTLQLTAASMIFGDFSNVVIGEWGMLEIALNPFANFQAAITGIRAIQTVDVGVRVAGAFSRATSIT